MNTATAASRFLEGFGLANAPLERCLDALTRVPDENAFRLPGGFDRYQHVRTCREAEHALHFLGEFTPPVVKHVLMQLDPKWTLCLDNSLPGPGFADDGPSLAQRTRVRVLRIANTPSRIWKRDQLREVMSDEARIFAVSSPTGAAEKAILAMKDDDRWSWHNSGPRYPVEETFDYAAKRVKDRFTEANLRQIIESMGAPMPTVEGILATTKFVLLKSPGQPERSITWEELDDPAYRYYQCGLGYVPHIKTHASSVVASFERAVRINPAYEPKVRAHIEAAKAILQRDDP